MGPTAIAIDADHNAFWFYDGGVYYHHDCRSDLLGLNHGVLVVGYGNDPDTHQDYWLVKNSWSEDWGDKGYIKIIRNEHNHCGVATMASIPLV